MSTASATPHKERRDGSAMPGMGEISRARHIVATLGGRFSLELGIEVDRDAHELERWALAATLIGESSPMSAAVHAYRALDRAGLETLADVEGCDREQLVCALDEGGFLRYDESAALELLGLAAAIGDRYPGGLAPLGEEIQDPVELERALCALPGWDLATARTFLRELRGVWAGADVPLDARASLAAPHVALPSDLDGLSALAAAAHLDFRDLESALIRLALVHDPAHCPGGEECPLAEADPEQFVHF
jgi:hypothetical protein